MRVCGIHVIEIQIKYRLLYCDSYYYILLSVMLKKGMLPFYENRICIWKIVLGPLLQFNWDLWMR